jgi:type 1 glutamine amidotransferase
MESIMRALVLCDDHWHPAKTVRAGLAPLEAPELGFDWLERANDWSAEAMANYPVTILAKLNEISPADRSPWFTPAIERAFVEYVEAGHGLLVIHAGTAGYLECTAMRQLVGGAFISHPPQCPVTVAPEPGHPLAAGAEPFTLVDEHYMMDFVDPEVEPLLTTSSEHGSQPGGWTRRQGAGRVCVLTPGHNLEVWLHPSYQTLIGNALRWCAAR